MNLTVGNVFIHNETKRRAVITLNGKMLIGRFWVDCVSYYIADTDTTWTRSTKSFIEKFHPVNHGESK